MTRSTRQRERQTETEEVEERDEQGEGVRGCPECDSSNLIKSSDRGELVCEDCGLVVEEENIDPGPEWRAFNLQQET
jgi:transcription initiation factor TFIIB